MKKLFIILLAALTLFLTACNNGLVTSEVSQIESDIISSSESSQEDSKLSSKEEMQLSSADEIISSTDYLSFLEGKTIIDSTALPSFAVTHELSSFLPGVDCVVLAKVKNIRYEAILGTGGAWTIATIEIIKTYRGDLTQGKQVDIYYIGGYISVEDHIKLCNDAFRFEDMTDEEKKNTYFHEIVGGEDFNPMGKTYLFCISKTLEGSPLPQDAYERHCLYTQMEYNENDKTFTQTLWDEPEKRQFIYTEEEIINAVEQYK